MCTSKTHRVRRKKKEKSERWHFPLMKRWAGRTEPPACGLRLEWRMDWTESVDGDERVGVGKGSHEGDSMSAFCRSESGRPGRLAPIFPQRINKTRSSQGIGGVIILRSPRQRLRASLIYSLISQSGKVKTGRAPVCTGYSWLGPLLFMYSRHKPQGSCDIITMAPATASDTMPHLTCTYFRTFRALSTPDFFSSQQANPALLSLSPTLNEPAQKFFYQFHLSTQNMATLQHLPVISAGLSTNLCLVILGVGTFLFSGWISARRRNLPPGPTSAPFIGNLHQISFHSQELCFSKWGKIFGTVVFPSRSAV
jgi:hypothetical protein